MTDPSSIFPLSTREWDYVAGRQHAPGLCVKEHELLRAVESGDIVKAKALLESGDVNANCIGKRRNQPIRALQLAAEKNDFHMIKLLLNYGAKPLPKPLPCLKPGNILEDDMRYGLYNAICSPAYLSLVNDDPIMAANEVNHELYKVSISKGIVETSKDKYVKLWRQVRAYSLDILTCCDSTQEARTLLLGRGMEHAVNDYTVRGKVLMSALENHNKQFISHYKCQNIVHKIWYRGQPEWYFRNGLKWTILYYAHTVMVYVVFLPILLLIYTILPCSPVSRIVDTPKSKFMSQMMSYLLFLILILILNVLLDNDPNTTLTTSYLAFLIFILIYVIAMIWGEITQIIILGMKTYCRDYWNYLDWGILLSFLFDIMLRLLDNSNAITISIQLQTFWVTWTAMALTTACIRFMDNFYLSSYLGSLMLLFAAMGDDVLKFLVIFAFAVMSFSFGFYYLFEGIPKNNFNKLNSSVTALISTIFGGDISGDLKVSGIVYNVSSEIHDVSGTYQAVGYILYTFFGTFVMLILVNICIAMMSDTYARLKEHIDCEWKFRRTSMWMNYVNASVLPAPYNIIPSFACCKYLCPEKCRCFNSRKIVQEDFEHNDASMKELHLVNIAANKRDSDMTCDVNLSYDELLNVLFNRYLIMKGIVDEETLMKSRPTTGPEDNEYGVSGREGDTLGTGAAGDYGVGDSDHGESL